MCVDCACCVCVHVTDVRRMLVDSKEEMVWIPKEGFILDFEEEVQGHIADQGKPPLDA